MLLWFNRPFTIGAHWVSPVATSTTYICNATHLLPVRLMVMPMSVAHPVAIDTYMGREYTPSHGSQLTWHSWKIFLARFCTRV